MLKAVTFDFWNTLFVDVHGHTRSQRRADILAAELRTAGASRPQPVVEEALRSGYDFFDQVWYHEQRTPGCAEILDHVLGSLRAQLPDDSHAGIVGQFETMVLDLPPKLSPEASEVLLELASDYRLGVICDTAYSPGEVLRDVMELHGILAAFDYLYFSNEHGVSKPHPQVFTQTLSQLGVSAREAAHVGDIQRTDIAGAQAAGMSAVHYVGANRHDAARSTADATVAHFEELPTVLSKLPRRRRRR